MRELSGLEGADDDLGHKFEFKLAYDRVKHKSYLTQVRKSARINNRVNREEGSEGESE